MVTALQALTMTVILILRIFSPCFLAICGFESVKRRSRSRQLEAMGGKVELLTSHVMAVIKSWMIVVYLSIDLSTHLFIKWVADGACWDEVYMGGEGGCEWNELKWGHRPGKFLTALFSKLWTSYKWFIGITGLSNTFPDSSLLFAGFFRKIEKKTI